MKGSKQFEENGSNDFVKRLGMKGSKSLGRRTGQRFCYCKSLVLKGSKSLRRRTAQDVGQRLWMKGSESSEGAMKGSKSWGRRTGQRSCSITWDEGFKTVWEGERVKDLVQKLGIKGLKSLVRSRVFS